MEYKVKSQTLLSLRPDDQVDINTSIDSDVSDFFDHTGRAVDVDDSLVDPHFEPVPGLGAFSARTLSRGNSENLRGNADGASGFVPVVLCS